jgi:hypothetical protein
MLKCRPGERRDPCTLPTTLLSCSIGTARLSGGPGSGPGATTFGDGTERYRPHFALPASGLAPGYLARHPGVPGAYPRSSSRRTPGSRLGTQVSVGW